MKSLKFSAFVAVVMASTIVVILGMRSILAPQGIRPPVEAKEYAAQPQTHVFLTPSPSGDDAAQIEQAFETAKEAGPGSIVELGEGTFTISRPITVLNFDGTFKGAGKGLTIVQNKFIPGGYFPVAPEPLQATTGLFTFYSTTGVARGGSADNPANLAFSDMTLKELGNGSPYIYHEGDPYLNYFGYFVLVAGRNVAGTNDGLPAFVNVTWERMGLVGEISESLPPTNMSSSYGLVVFGWTKKDRVQTDEGWIITPETFDPQPITGTFTVADCTFEKMEAPFAVYGADNSDIAFRNSVASDVVWTGAHFWSVKSTLRPSNIDVSNVKIVNPASTTAYTFGINAVALWRISGANVNVTGLDTTNISGVWVNQKIPSDSDPSVITAPSTFFFSKNTIRMLPDSWWAGFELYDWVNRDTGVKTANVILDKNNITSNDTDSYYNAIYSENISDAVVSKNKISGTGVTGILEWSDGWTITKNDMRDLTVSDQGWNAKIVLAGNDNVVSGNKDATVVDYGTGNMVVGSNATKKVIKPELKAAKKCLNDVKRGGMFEQSEACGVLE